VGRRGFEVKITLIYDINVFLFAINLFAQVTHLTLGVCFMNELVLPPQLHFLNIRSAYNQVRFQEEGRIEGGRGGR
jgi:hypothetical protein